MHGKLLGQWKKSGNSEVMLKPVFILLECGVVMKNADDAPTPYRRTPKDDAENPGSARSRKWILLGKGERCRMTITVATSVVLERASSCPLECFEAVQDRRVTCLRRTWYVLEKGHRDG